MYKLCKSEKSALRQRQLEEGLLAMMKNCHYEDITVSDLCQYLQIPRKSFYRYFSSKEGALHGLIDHTLLEYELYGSSHIPEKRTLQGDLEKFFWFWKDNHLILDAIEKSTLSGVLIERTISYALMDAVFPGRYIPGETKPVQTHVVRFAVCGLMSMMLQWHHGGHVESVPEMAQIAGRLLTQPLFATAKDIL